MDRFRGKIIAVTGGGSGLGEAIVLRLAREGARVAIIDASAENAAQVAARVKGATAHQADVSDPAAMMDVFAAIAATHGGLDGAVNNAGIGGPRLPVADYPIEAWDRTIAVNLNGVFYSMRAQIPHLVARGGGSIVNMGSICSVVGQDGTAAYAASKHGVIGLTKSAALEYGRERVRVNAVCPTYVRTPLTESLVPSEEVWAALDARHATGRCPTPDEVAAMVAFLLSDEAASITGSAHMVDAGFTAA
jgi:NAD(P)-dependent dehydrogenase (short-subunit alcohol dehydrogenase family)